MPPSAATQLVGRRVSKLFDSDDGLTPFGGTVKSYDSTTRWFRVVYDDGDEEELNAKQLQEVLVQAATSGATTKKKAAALTPALLAAAAAAADALMSEDAVTAVIANGCGKKGGGVKSKKSENGAGGRKRATAKEGGGAAKKVKAEPKGKRVKKEEVDVVVREEATFDNAEFELWAPEEQSVPSPLPRTIRTLELFAGCGGLHGDGEGRMKGMRVDVKTVAAVEVEGAPSETYKHNFPQVNVLRIGVSRFLATARRLMRLKKGETAAKRTSAAQAACKITDFMVDFDEATQVWSKEDTGTTKRQDMDSVTTAELRGEAPLSWLQFRVKRGGKEDWVRDGEDETEGMAVAVHNYLNSSAFGPSKFPLPGDIEMITGGPPCQGWSGYNTTRITAEDLRDLMTHKENRLLARWLEIIWVFRPLYFIMEEVPDVFSKAGGAVLNWMQKAYDSKGYAINYQKRLTTGLYGCPQTRDRLVVLGAMKGLACPEFPPPVTRHWDDDEATALKAFDSSMDAYPLPMNCEPSRGSRGKKVRHTADMRALVLGDALSCDLPIDGTTLRQKRSEEVATVRHEYATPPPTPYIAYLRQGADSQYVANHCLYELGHSDQLRVNLVPYRRDAGWRDMPAAHREELCYMKAPMAMVLTAEQFTNNDISSSIWSRQLAKIPAFMIKGGEEARSGCREGEMPELKEGWAMEKNRFPLAPYWCLTMKHARDHDCYGRLWYSDVHPTVHSYHKPHWHRSLVPFAPRVMTVREKARIQGFPDKFVFQGTLDHQYKQIANAVSPQLTKSLMRGILTAHARNCLAAADKSAEEPALEYSESLRTFADFMGGFDVESMPKLQRHTPKKVPDIDRPPLEPMTYSEIIVEYNTEWRNDHSTRYAHMTPFEVLEAVEDNHQWHTEKILGIRVIKLPRAKGFLTEVLLKYQGFPTPEWYPEDTAIRKLPFYQDFVQEVGHDLMKELNAGKAMAWLAQREAVVEVVTEEVAPRALRTAAGEEESAPMLVSFVAHEGADVEQPPGTTDPQLARADEAFEVMAKRYKEEKAAGQFPAKHVSKNKHAKEQVAKRRAKQAAQAQVEASGDSANNSAAESGDEADEEADSGAV